MNAPLFQLWRDVPGFVGHYRVSDLGNVRSVNRLVPVKGQSPRQRQGQVLSTKTNAEHYKAITLVRPGKRKTFAVHTLVLLAFRGPRPLGHEARHLNGKKWDNALSNLVWATHKENESDKIGHGTQMRGASHPNTKISPAAVVELRRMVTLAGTTPGGRVPRHTFTRLAKMFGISASYAQSIAAGIDRADPGL